jgi:hypothetical protein
MAPSIVAFEHRSEALLAGVPGVEVSAIGVSQIGRGRFKRLKRNCCCKNVTKFAGG